MKTRSVLYKDWCVIAFGLAARMLVMLASMLTAGCGLDSSRDYVPGGDLVPPMLSSAAPRSERTFVLDFSEAVVPVVGSFVVEPGSPGQLPVLKSTGSGIEVEFVENMIPGAEYKLAGEVQDSAGNVTRFLLSFPGFNGRPAALVLSEIQTGKNASAQSPHRDFIEFLVVKKGNLAGLEVSWASSVKVATYRFAGAEVESGDYVILHCAPEGLPGELDETGPDTGLSSGADATLGGRDFWTQEGGLPDSSGAVALRTSPDGPVQDFLFYCDEDKEGVLKKDKLSEFIILGLPVWEIGESPAWDEAFRRKTSSSRSMARNGTVLSVLRTSAAGEVGAAGAAGADSLPPSRIPGAGKDSWYLCDSGAQSPGSANVLAIQKPESAKSVSTRKNAKKTKEKPRK